MKGGGGKKINHFSRQSCHCFARLRGAAAFTSSLVPWDHMLGGGRAEMPPLHEQRRGWRERRALVGRKKRQQTGRENATEKGFCTNVGFNAQ